MKRNTKRIFQWLVALLLLSQLIACGSETTESTTYKNINNDELQQMLDKNVNLIDIRRPEEWKQTGIIENSKTLTFFLGSGQVNPEFMSQFQHVATDKNKPVIIICRTGSRSKAASEYISKSLGYSDVYNVTHGITGWIREGRKVVAP